MRLASPAFVRVLTAALVAFYAPSAFAQPASDATGDTPPPPPPSEATTEAPADTNAPARIAPASSEEAPAGEASASETAEITPDEAEGTTRETDFNINNEGGVGFHGIAAARAGRITSFRAAFLGQISSGENVVRAGDANTRAVGNVLFQSTINQYFAINAGIRASNNTNTFGQPEAMLSQGDFHLGAAGYYQLDPAFHIGGDLTLFIPADFGTAGLAGSGTSVRPRLLATLDTRPLTDGEVPLDIHANLAYFADGSQNAVADGVDLTRVERYAYGVSAYSFVEVGLGFEYDLPYVTPFLGWQLRVPVAPSVDVCGGDFLCPEEADGFAGPQLLTLGVRGEPIEHLGLHAGVDISLTGNDAAGIPVTPPANFTLGVSWTIDPTPKVEYVEKVIEKEKIVDKTPAQGVLAGSIIDSDTQKPIGGVLIEYVGSSFTPQSTNPVDGTFRSYGVPPETPVVLRFSHPDYEPLEVKQTIAEGERTLNFSLKAIPKKADLTGRVLDTKDKPIDSARVKLTGEGDTKVVSVDAAGAFRQEVKPGRYTVAITAEGYLTKGRDVEIKPNEKLSLDFVLTPKPKVSKAKISGKKIVISDKIFFETGEAAILSKSYGLLDQIVAILIENPQVKQVRIEGHTDDKGSDATNLDLSQRRAEAVRAYLIDQGVSADRLVAKGFGSSLPILPNISKRNRALNRRVEFTIVDQPEKGEPIE
jgi:outer membrane protein OmpA-like peptidoglycan-associated protein